MNRATPHGRAEVARLGGKAMTAACSDDRSSVEPIAVSPGEAARLAGIGRTTIYASISAGELRSIKLCKRRLIAIDALREWLRAHEVRA
jgi:excisionase family DNA binding protein